LKPDRFVIASVLFLCWGLWLIFGYCNGTAGMSVASPLSGASLNICITTKGPGAAGGVALVAMGVLLLIWALIWSIAGQFRRDESSGKAANLPRSWDWKDRS
jgi:hypothetical protein